MTSRILLRDCSYCVRVDWKVDGKFKNVFIVYANILLCSDAQCHIPGKDASPLIIIVKKASYAQLYFTLSHRMPTGVWTVGKEQELSCLETEGADIVLDEGCPMALEVL